MKDPNCVFCKIVAGEIPSYKIHEDDKFFAFLDASPRSPGHTLIIPKDHHRWVWDVSQFSQYFETAKLIAMAIRKAYNTDSVWEVVQGDEVPHAHVSVFPHPDTTPGDKKDFSANAEKIRTNLD
jgi:histidine triad (HIT) family protein